MLNGIRKKTVAVMAAPALLLVGTAFASPASAAHVSCGATITQSTTLHENVGPCDQGLNVTASNIVINLNGFTITGSGPATAGTIGIGIALSDVSGVMVRNGRVTGFGAGMYIQGGANNLVQAMTIDNNVGAPGADLGDGIVIDRSNSNRVRNSTIRNNGPYDGIGLINGSSFNTINNNIIDSNNVPGMHDGVPVIQQDDGVRIEGPNAKSNAVLNNTISNNGLDGVAVFGTGNLAGNTDNVIKNNNIMGNGFHNFEQRRGNGILLFPTAANTLVKENFVIGNAANGIRVEGQNNRIVANSAFDNGSGALQPGTAFDLLDVNPNCDNNTWRANAYRTASPPCTTIGGTQVPAS